MSLPGLFSSLFLYLFPNGQVCTTLDTLAGGAAFVLFLGLFSDRLVSFGIWQRFTAHLAPVLSLSLRWFFHLVWSARSTALPETYSNSNRATADEVVAVGSLVFITDLSIAHRAFLQDLFPGLTEISSAGAILLLFNSSISSLDPHSASVDRSASCATGCGISTSSSGKTLVYGAADRAPWQCCYFGW